MGLSSNDRPSDMPMDEKFGEEDSMVSDEERAEREKGELRPKDRESEFDRAG